MEIKQANVRVSTGQYEFIEYTVTGTQQEIDAFAQQEQRNYEVPGKTVAPEVQTAPAAPTRTAQLRSPRKNCSARSANRTCSTSKNSA
jgi:hypothetical protein